MGLFNRKRIADLEERIASLSELKTMLDRTGVTASGVVVTPDRAMRQADVWACLELIAGVGASLPLVEYRDSGDRQVRVPLSPVFADPDPDPSITAVHFRQQVLRSVAARGNAYALVLGDPMGYPYGMQAIHPDRVRWDVDRNTGRWITLVDGVERARWPLGDLWHFALYQQPGSPEGLSPIEYHKQTIGQSLAAAKFGQQFFDSGGNPAAIVKTPQKLADGEAVALKQSVVDATRGNREPLILPQEITFEKLTITAEDSQFLETQKYGTSEIARIFLGGFPELIGGAVSGSSVTYTNREQRLADWLALSMTPRYLIPLEAMYSTLIPRGRKVKHNVNALLRSDLAGRFSAYKVSAEVEQLTGKPIYTNDEMRGFEDLEPLPADYGAATPRAQSPNAEMRGLVVNTPPINVTTPPVTNVIHLPEQREQVMPAPVVNVHVDPTPITNVVQASDVPVNVTVPEALVHVSPQVVLEERPTRKTVNYDARGRVSEITEEPI